MRVVRHVLVLLAVLPANAFADVVVPAFSAPFFPQALQPVLLLAVCAVESFICLRREPNLGGVGAVTAIALANTASWAVGVALGVWVFPMGYGSPEAAEVYYRLVWLNLPVAYMLSVAVEGAAYRAFSKQYSLRGPWSMSLLANSASYALIALGFWVYRDAI